MAVEHAGTRQLILRGLRGALRAGAGLVRVIGQGGKVRAVVSLVMGVTAVVKFVVALVSGAFGALRRYGWVVRGWGRRGVPGMS